MFIKYFLIVGFMAASLITSTGFGMQCDGERTVEEKIEIIEALYSSSPEAAMVCQKYNYQSQCTQSMTAWNCRQLGGYYHCFRQMSPYSHWCGTCLP